MKIKNIKGREILDSRGNPTVEVDVILESGVMGRAAVPSGASTGSHEAHELRDGDANRYKGKGVLRAIDNVNTEIACSLIGLNSLDQRHIDNLLVNLDGTKNKSRLGANAILGVSLACAKASALESNVNLFEYINNLSSEKRTFSMPMPLCNVINGGQHASGSTDIQEFMIVPIGGKQFKEALRMNTEVFHSLKNILKDKGYGTTVGDEGGYAPAVKNGNKEALSLIREAVEATQYDFGKDIAVALDVAATELYKDGRYSLLTENRSLDSNEMIAFYQDLQKDYPLVSIEDGLAEDDWSGWKSLTEKMGDRTQLVGDDLLVTNVEFLKKAIQEKASNSILIKVNQIGTLSETIEAVDLAHKSGFRAIISHRSGETEDTTISHLAVGLGTGQIKTGSMSRTDRLAKYNELLRIEEMLGEKAEFANNII